MNKLLTTLTLAALTLSAKGILTSSPALASTAPAAVHKTAAPTISKSTVPQPKPAQTSAEADARLILERVKLARMWIKQNDDGEAIRQIRDAMQVMNQMTPKLTAPLEELIYSARTGRLIDAKGQVMQNFVPIETALDELTTAVGTQPVAQNHLNNMKQQLSQARLQLQKQNEPAAKVALKGVDVELAQFEIDMPVTYTEAHLHKAYGFLREAQPLSADNSLKEIEKHLVARSATTFLGP